VNTPPKGFISAADFDNPPEVPSKDPPSKDPEPPKKFMMKGSDLKFAFDLLRVLNSQKLADRDKMPIPNSDLFRHGLSPEKAYQVLGFITDLELDLFGKRDFFNENVAAREELYAQLNGSHDHTEFEVHPHVEAFIPKDLSPDEKARVRSLHMRILVAIANKSIKREDVAADPPVRPPLITYSADEIG